MSRGQKKLKPNRIEIEGDVARLYLHRKDGTVLSTIIDASEVERVSQHHWYALWDSHTQSFYARCNVRDQYGKRTAYILSRFLEEFLLRNLPLGAQIDHINHDTLDNRHSNLRLATNSQNNMNRRKRVGTSQYKGVCWHRARGKWQAYIVFNKQHIYLGYFDSEPEGARVYDVKARELFGEHALLNFPNEAK